eukprot:jgi/Phyca11/123770/e_gw1.51.308.1
MREAIYQKPFTAKYSDAGRVEARTAERVSTGIRVVVIDKQVQARMGLKKNWRAGELRSALGSGIEEDRSASNVQSHYETLAGLIAQCVALEADYTAKKKKRQYQLVRISDCYGSYYTTLIKSCSPIIE